MLDRYTWRHDSILRELFNQLESTDDEYQIYIDIEGLNIAGGTIHPNITPTTQRPDLIIVWPTSKQIAIVELTIPFELNATKAHKRKQERYEKLVRDIETVGFKVYFYAIEIGCRGHITKDNTNRIKSLFKRCKRPLNSTLVTLSKYAIISSFTIFYSRHERHWVNPDLLSLT